MLECRVLSGPVAIRATVDGTYSSGPCPLLPTEPLRGLCPRALQHKYHQKNEMRPRWGMAVWLLFLQTVTTSHDTCGTGQFSPHVDTSCLVLMVAQHLCWKVCAMLPLGCLVDRKPKTVTAASIMQMKQCTDASSTCSSTAKQCGSVKSHGCGSVPVTAVVKISHDKRTTVRSLEGMYKGAEDWAT